MSQLQQPSPQIFPSDTLQRAWIALQRVAPQLRDAIDAQLKDAGLPDLADYSILWALDRAGAPIRPRDLGLLLFIPRYQISRMVDRLVDIGLVLKRNCPEDRRGHLLSLTETGRALRLQIWNIYGPAMSAVMSPLDQDELRILSRLLNKLGGLPDTSKIDDNSGR